MKGKKFLAFSLAAALLAGGVMNVSAAGVQDIFDANTYAKYADLKAVYGTDAGALLGHFLATGAKEGRIASDILDVAAYRKAYADLDAQFGDNWDAYVDHYLTYGIKEKRTTGVLFDLADYAAKNPDVKAAYGEDYAAIAQHYINCGKAEGRKGGEIKKAETPAAGSSSNNPGSSNGSNKPAVPDEKEPTETVVAGHAHPTTVKDAVAKGDTYWGGQSKTCTTDGYVQFKCTSPVMENVYDSKGNWLRTRQKHIGGIAGSWTAPDGTVYPGAGDYAGGQPVVCDAVYSIVDKAGHSAPTGTANLYVIHPTCYAPGVMKYTCTVCGAEVKETAPQLQHDFRQVYYGLDGKETFTEIKGREIFVESKSCKAGDEGYNLYKCFNCGLENKKPRALLNHKLGGFPNIVEASTCTKNGKAYGHCDACGLDVYSSLPLAAHNTKDTTNVKVYADAYLDATGARKHDVWSITYCKDCKVITEDPVKLTVTPDECVDNNVIGYNPDGSEIHDGVCDICKLKMDRPVTTTAQIKSYKKGETYIGPTQ